MCGNNIETQVTVTHSSPVSPPPYMVGMVEIELDKETGQVDILDYVAVVDCGTVINTNFSHIQTCRNFILHKRVFRNSSTFCILNIFIKSHTNSLN